MFERAQSESVGVILLTAVITLTVTGAGAVVLSEWQADIEEGPMADIESEATPIDVTLDHRGGDTLSPNETTIRLVGVEENMSLENPLAPGTSSNKTFDDPILNGRFELLVIHDPTETVVHSETYDFESTVDRLAFKIANESDPAYVLKDKPANYTVEEIFEFDDREISRTVTDEAIIPESSKLEVNQSASTITGNETGTVNVTAEVGNESTETEVRILESDPSLAANTVNVTPTSATTAEVTGNLTDLGGLPAANLGFEYTPYRKFNRDSEDNGDGIVTYGEWQSDPDGYRVTRYMHDNQELEPGETRVYTLNNTESGVDYEWYFRDAEWTRTWWISDDFHRTLETFVHHPQGTYRMEVTVADDGSTADVILYQDVEGDEIRYDEYGVDLEGNDEVYFSLHQRGGGTGADSMRLLNVYQPNDSFEEEAEPERADSANTTFWNETGGLD
ncbi:MAG: type IV pilin, partial [Halohasta sp.]